MKYLMMLVLISIAVPVLAEQYAATDDGKTVLLNDDGTWEYTEEGERIVAEERKEFWTGIAINVAKILAILAALITLRFVIQAVGKGRGAKSQNGHEKTED